MCGKPYSRSAQEDRPGQGDRVERSLDTRADTALAIDERERITVDTVAVLNCL